MKAFALIGNLQQDPTSRNKSTQRADKEVNNRGKQNAAKHDRERQAGTA